MPSRVEVLFIDESDFVNKGIGFILGDCSDWDPYHINFNFGTETSAGRKKKTSKGKQRSGNNRRRKQSKEPNVNSSEVTSTHNSNENAKMQANHSRYQNRKAAKVLLSSIKRTAK